MCMDCLYGAAHSIVVRKWILVCSKLIISGITGPYDASKVLLFIHTVNAGWLGIEVRPIFIVQVITLGHMSIIADNLIKIMVESAILWLIEGAHMPFSGKKCFISGLLKMLRKELYTIEGRA